MTRGWMAALAVTLGAGLAAAQEPLTGSLSIHDPSTMIKHGNRYYIFATGNNIASKSSADKMNWSSGPAVFSSPPAWTTAAVPGFGGNFWAPDIIYLNGQYHLYYSVSSFGSQTSAIGLVTNPALDPADPSYAWTDQGAVIQSGGGLNYNAIDPSVLLAADGTLWLAFGSFWDGIKMIQLDPATGKRIAPGSAIYALAEHPPSTAIEAACLIQRSNYFYLFVAWDRCCAALNSTYNIRVGRSTNVLGPYLDRSGFNLTNNGGTAVLESTGRFVGPGHAGIFSEGETNWFTYHYYDGTNNGASRLGMARLYWSADGWPQVTNDWCAFYPFEADAREHRGFFNGTLRNGAIVTDEPGRGPVLNLDGASQYVTLPWSVANASTFAAWVKWNGGNDWQRILDFGSNSLSYFFLTPRNGQTGRLRFTIKSRSSNEQVLDAPSALPTNSWCHVAVTHEGARGLLYLNGKPVATNNGMTIRPWQVLARTNYIGDSQFAVDPTFNGRIDSLRIYGRTLSGAEIQQLAEAHPSLAHRYSFTTNSSDAIGAAHGRLFGNAIVTNGALALEGVSGTYAGLPGGLVSGCTAVSLEFWATLGANGDWARVFDFGNSNFGSGQNFLYFSPHTGSGSHRFTLSTSGGTRDQDVPGTLDGRTVHVVCIADPGTGYSAIYTNGILDSETNGPLPSLSGVNAALSYLGRSLFITDAWLNGSIDEFRIYHGRLTPQEIAADYAAGPDALALPVSLTIARTPAGVEVSWPSYAAGFKLQASPTLDAGALWTTIDLTPALDAGFYRVTLPLTGEAQFVRLRK